MTTPAQPLVSVICACYNHAPYIEACLNSVLEQTYPNIELIVIDDGSSDGSIEKIRALQKQHGFYFEAQPNQGLAATLNKAIGLSKGKYIAQIGSDDIFTADKIEKQVAFMESRPDIAICGGNMLVIDEHGVVQQKQKTFPYRELNFEDLFAQRKAGIPASSSMIRRDVLEKEGAYEPDIRLEDMYLWFKLLSRGHTMAGLEDTVLYYRKHGSNTYRNYRFMYENMMKTYAPYKNHPLYEDVVNRYRLSSVLALAKHGDKPLARAILKEIPAKYFSMKLLRAYFHAWKPF